MTRDLVDYMDSTYRTIARREARWIEGFSMGGYGALHLTFGHPETYGAVSMIAGALLRRLEQEPIERTHDTFFDDQEYFTACHPITLLEKNGDALRNRTLVRLLSAELDTRQTEPIAAMQRNMERLKVPHKSIEIKGADHSYDSILAGTGSYAYEFWAEAAARMKSS
jgi:enterochelin esterase-like enzyme